jgi:Methyltransferase domain
VVNRISAGFRVRRLSRRVPPEDDPDDFVGYEVLVDFIKRRRLQKLEGDIVEIGAYMGRGTARLAKLARRYGKKVYAVDTFDPGLDTTLSKSGVRAGDVYRAFLKGRSMLETYQESIRGFDNVITVKADSRTVTFPSGQKFVFGFIDGRHQRAYVENDFHLIWPHIVSGGVLGLHDYEFDDWPEVTGAARKLMCEREKEISAAYEIKGKYDILSLLLVKK